MKRSNVHSRVLLVLLHACAIGCSASDADVPDARPVKNAGGKVAAPLTQQPTTSVRDAHVQTFDTIRTIPPAILDQMQTQEEMLKEHGLPRYRPIYVRGHYAAAYVEPETNKIAWRGMTCTHEDCSGEGHEGGPFVFADVYPGVRVDAGGQLVGRIQSKDVRCPACNRIDAIERYSPPVAVERRSALLIELAEIRAARDEARRSGQPLPELTTTPREIQNELANLPVLYLVEE